MRALSNIGYICMRCGRFGDQVSWCNISSFWLLAFRRQAQQRNAGRDAGSRAPSRWWRHPAANEDTAGARLLWLDVRAIADLTRDQFRRHAAQSFAKAQVCFCP